MSLLSSTWRYRSLLGTSEYPIQRIAQKRLHSLLDGQLFYETYASLHPSLDGAVQGSGLYGSAAGTGTSTSRLESTFIALSEALERWAVFSNLSDKGRDFKKLHFDAVPSSIGIAAFPGSLTRSRTNALQEARERWLISTWWNGDTGILERRQLGEQESFVLASPWPETQVCLTRTVWDTETGRQCYAFGAGHSKYKAEANANRELERNLRALQKGTSQSLQPSYIEKRLLWCSNKFGNSAIQDRILSYGNKSTPSCPGLVVDAEVVGPWTRWAKVWRCLYPMPSDSIDPAVTEHLLF